MDWLFAAIDGSRPHAVGWHVSWHGRFMVVGWGVLVPLGVLAARYFKVLPGQRYPEVLDVRVWWHTHLTAQICALAMSLVAIVLILTEPGPIVSLTAASWLHRALGWSIAMLAVMQGLSGLSRGTRGGPGQILLRGDHYDMSPRRLAFEVLHKTMGHVALALAGAAVLTGMWQANAPVWMWIVIPGWWMLLAGFFAVFERRGMVVDTYEAIWGPDPSHPGNARRRQAMAARGDPDGGRSDR